MPFMEPIGKQIKKLGLKGANDKAVAAEKAEADRAMNTHRGVNQKTLTDLRTLRRSMESDVVDDREMGSYLAKIRKEGRGY